MGGPTLIADREHIKAVRESATVRIVDMQKMSEDDPRMIASNDKFSGFRSAMGRIRRINDEEVVVSTRFEQRLGVNIGDSIRILSI
jgi:arginine/ornithine N-succinyltransferase beta subunit